MKTPLQYPGDINTNRAFVSTSPQTAERLFTAALSFRASIALKNFKTFKGHSPYTNSASTAEIDALRQWWAV